MIVDAIILTGGEGSRLGGVDKAALTIGDSTLLDRALEATAGCRDVVVVGPRDERRQEVLWTREDPPGGGPVAGLAAGVAALPDDADLVLVLACDMPRAASVAPALMAKAVNGLTVADGAWGVDSSGRFQPLLAVYGRVALQRALGCVGDPHGASMRVLTSALRMTEVPVGEAARDADTWDDVRVLREEST
ncbi:molybdenum cofactor guanylyltransferase [Demequina activiva]|uniref:MobA-like NTP transferase domain-containing protein n=1 Tax=Demequina activiva TaxID=1582364 RepID=A0A919Q3B1_9MICO|nr:NTP transferase domain-containing protein [Demequina activiva]GIG55051.1 hypothetical protein Dac01nite_18030 [Demequina activiva]